MRQVSHLQPGYSGEKSSWYWLFFSLMDPNRVSAVPKRAVLQGNVQSNMSTPRAAQTNMSSG